MLRICKYCKAVYDGDPGSSCCRDCAVKQRATSLRERVCRTCGAPFLGGPRAWYCPTCRAERKLEADRRHKRTGSKRKIGSTDLCEICGKPYIVASGRQRYCRDCAPGAVRAVDRAQSKEWAALHTTPQSRREERQEATAPIPCAVCGKLFVPDSVAITCGPECSSALRSRRQKVWETEHRRERSAYHAARRRQRGASAEDQGD